MPTVVSVLRVSVVLIALTSIGANGLSTNKGMAQSKNDELVVLAKVIGVEAPELPWPMHFQSLKHFYLKIEKVISGQEKASYIRVAYGYNPTLQTETILPDEMFDGKSVWEFRLHRWEMFDGVAELSKQPGDRLDEKHAKKVKDGKIVEAAINPKCIPTDGNHEDAQTMEKLGKLKGYWLDWKKYEKAPMTFDGNSKKM